MKKNIKKYIILLIVIIISVYILFFYNCPIKQYLGFDCPGCGLTRALKSLLILDFRSAFEFNPMIFILLPEAVYYIFSRYIVKKKLKAKTEQVILISTLILTIIVWILKLFFN